MDTEVIVALITGMVTIASVIISNKVHSSEMSAKLDKALAIQETKLDNLTQEVHKHNNFAQRMPVIEEQIKVINHRLEDLERNNK